MVTSDSSGGDLPGRIVFSTFDAADTLATSRAVSENVEPVSDTAINTITICDERRIVTANVEVVETEAECVDGCIGGSIDDLIDRTDSGRS